MTTDEKIDTEWYRATVFGGVTVLNESLRQFATLSTALFGLAAAFFAKADLPLWSRDIGCGILLITLGASLYGSLPLKLSFGPILEIIREERNRLYQFKLRWYRVAVVSLFVSLAVFFAGILWSAVIVKEQATPPEIKQQTK